ncbi:MAG: hypothetical protein HYW47_02075 [Deltaproteobacteria bacterium]|nr:hypothetical protein [Deltaproteobacteria bacterium]
MKKIVRIIGYSFLGIVFIFYFTYLNLPYQKILDRYLPSSVDLKTTVEPSYFGSIVFRNVQLKYPLSPMPLLTNISEFEIGLSWLSLLLGNANLKISLVDWSDQNLGFKKTTIENLRINTSILGLKKLISQNFSETDPFHVSVVSDTDTNDILLDLDWTFKFNPRYQRMSEFKAKVKLKLSRNLASLEPLLSQTGINMGAKKNDFYHFEVTQDSRGFLSSKPL